MFSLFHQRIIINLAGIFGTVSHFVFDMIGLDITPMVTADPEAINYSAEVIKSLVGASVGGTVGLGFWILGFFIKLKMKKKYDKELKGEKPEDL